MILVWFSELFNKEAERRQNRFVFVFIRTQKTVLKGAKFFNNQFDTLKKKGNFPACCKTVLEFVKSASDVGRTCRLQVFSRRGSDFIKDYCNAFQNLAYPSICKGRSNQSYDFPVPKVRVIIEKFERIRMNPFA